VSGITRIEEHFVAVLDEQKSGSLRSSRVSVSKGLVTIGSATVLLFIVSALLDSASVSSTSFSGMLPIAAVLAIAGLGQMLVVQQGGIDLSVAGGISLALVIVTHIPDGDSSRLLPAILLAVFFAVCAGVLNGVLIGGLGLNPIIATLGTNAVLYGVNLGISGGRPRITTRLLGNVAGGSTAGIPHAVFFALGALALVSLLVKGTVSGRRFEAIGANARAARAAGLRVRTYRSLCYVWAQLLYCLGGILIAGITSQPTAYAGDTFLLPSIAVVVLGGTSLLGGRGFPLPTVIAAVFLQQLIQLVSVLGVSPAISPLVQAAALAIGISLYTVNWAAILAVLTRRSEPAVARG
jgi:ribose transport system permease protein